MFAFIWVPKEHLTLYTSGLITTPDTWRVWGVSVEHYLSSALASAIGPVIALGNPLDVLPSEGVARIYAEDDGDEGWKRQFRELAASAAALLMTVAWSDGLRWELGEIRRFGWHTKLFIVTAPASDSMRLADRLFALLIGSAAEVPRRPWPATAGQLRDTGYRVDAAEPPPPGSVIAFDERGTAMLLVQGALAPEEYAAALRSHLIGTGGSLT